MNNDDDFIQKALAIVAGEEPVAGGSDGTGPETVTGQQLGAAGAGTAQTI
jgi:hypothetical protein